MFKRDIALPFVIGHRGAAGLAPENTLASIARAADEGAGWVEFDVMLSADSVPMIIHDDDVKRTTDGRGEVAAQSAAALKALDAGSWFDPAYAGERIPALGDVIDLLSNLGLGANVEIKPYPGHDVATAEAVCDALKSGWPKVLPAPVISSFSSVSMAVARDLAPEISRAMLFYGLPNDWREVVDDLDCDAVHLYNRSTTQAAVKAITEAGLPLRVYTINDPKRAQELRAWGVQSVFTDRPDLIRD